MIEYGTTPPVLAKEEAIIRTTSIPSLLPFSGNKRYAIAWHMVSLFIDQVKGSCSCSFETLRIVHYGTQMLYTRS